MQINRLPIPRGDETLYSVAARTRLSNAARNDRDACRSLFGPSLNMRVSEFPVNVAHFCAVTKEQFGNPQSVLDEMTVAPFFDRIGGRPWHAGSSDVPVATAGYGLSTLSNGDIWTWRACARCVKSDMTTNPTAYWRRAHQLPTAFFCIDHGTPLCASVAPVLKRHNQFLLPEETILNHTFGRADLSKVDEVLMGLTQLCVDALKDRGDAVDPKTRHATMLHALDDHGLLNSSGLIRLEPFAKEFSRRYGFMHQYPDFATVVSQKGISILSRSLRRSNSWRLPAHNLMLIAWLFGSWGAFTKQCDWQSVTGHQRQTTEDPVADEIRLLYYSEQQAHRRICLDFVSQDSSTLRSAFARAAPKSFRWLLRNDSEWLDQYCSTARYGKIQLELF